MSFRMKSRYPSNVNRDGMISKFPKISALELVNINKIFLNLKIILVSTLIATIALFIFQKFEFKINLISIDLFLIIEGPIILTLTLFYLVKSMKIKNVINCIQEPNYIAALGIFLSFLVLWPVNILQNYFLKDTSTFFNFFFIANSTSYLIFFSFLTYSFYGTRK